MGTIAVTAQQDKGRARIDLDWLTHPAPWCWVYRSTVGGVPALIREGNPCVLSNAKATIYDVEGPLDVLTYYQSTVPLNDNGTMEAGVEEWQSASTTGGTAAQSTDYFYAGSASLQFVPSGSAAAPTVLSEEFAVTVGVVYTANAQVLATSTWTGGVGLVISWYTAAHALLSTSGTAANLWPAVGDWDPYTVTGTAPATAAFGRVGLLFAGTPSVDKVFYLDECYVTTALGTIDTSAAPIALSSAVGGWWKNPLQPATMVRLQDALAWACNGKTGVALIGVSGASRPADGAVLEVASQSLGVGSFSPRKAARRTIQVASGSVADADALRDLHAPGGQLLLQLNAAYGVPAEYALYGDLSSLGLGGDMTRQVKVFQADMIHSQNPPGPAEGVLGVRYQDLRVKGAKLTYAAAATAGYTWLDALKGNIA